MQPSEAALPIGKYFDMSVCVCMCVCVCVCVCASSYTKSRPLPDMLPCRLASISLEPQEQLLVRPSDLPEPPQQLLQQVPLEQQGQELARPAAWEPQRGLRGRRGQEQRGQGGAGLWLLAREQAPWSSVRHSRLQRGLVRSGRAQPPVLVQAGWRQVPVQPQEAVAPPGREPRDRRVPPRQSWVAAEA